MTIIIQLVSTDDDGVRDDSKTTGILVLSVKKGEGRKTLAPSLHTPRSFVHPLRPRPDPETLPRTRETRRVPTEVPLTL